MADASFFATDLFFEAFRSAFPVPPRGPASGRANAESDVWRQYVAFYQWSASSVEPVAFANFIRRGDVYLEGGLCARRSFYRRLPERHWRECKARGGIVQILLEHAARELNDALAWFGYCGDAKSWRVNERIGYERTAHRHLIVRWIRPLPDSEKRTLEATIAAIGPF